MHHFHIEEFERFGVSDDTMNKISWSELYVEELAQIYSTTFWATPLIISYAAGLAVGLVK